MNRILISAVALLASACTTAMYNGPRRPASELALLASDDSVISAIDGVQTPYSGGNYGKYQVLPGEHSIGVTLNRVVFGVGTYYADTPYTLCVRTEAGKEYRVKIEMAGYMWRPYMVEEKSGEPVSRRCYDDSHPPKMSELQRLLDQPLLVTPRKP